MCTAIFIPRKVGYLLAMNRDEQLSRVAALPPARYRIEGAELLFPSEPGGGTWIGLNDGGVGLALVNWYAISRHVTGPIVSRGQVVRTALSARSVASVEERLTRLSLDRIRPFRLIGIVPATQQVVEWRWDLIQLERVDHAWSPAAWISSGWDEPGAQASRSRSFQRALTEKSAGTLPWLRRLHRSHAPEPGAYSICMHRSDAATVSYTEIAVSSTVATLNCRPGAPCCSGTRSVGGRLTLHGAATGGVRGLGH